MDNCEVTVYPPQTIGVEPRSPPTAYSLFDGMSPNWDEVEDEFTSINSVAWLSHPPTIKNCLSAKIKYHKSF